MPWLFSKNIDPPLTPSERETLDKGESVARQLPDGVLVIGPKVVTGPEISGPVTGLGVTFGPNGEDAFFHAGGRLAAHE